jgi:hypothetical protein
VAPGRKGCAWIAVDVSAAVRFADRLKLRIRVVDKRGVSNRLTAVFLGAVQIRESN